MPPRHHSTWALSYGERSDLANLTPLAAYLLRLMQLKRTNLCVSADVTTTAELLQIAEDVGDHICVLKTHADIIDDFGDRTIRGLNEISQRKKFVVFEDRKFGDIGNTVQQQYTGGRLTIVRWAPIVNAHIFPGPAVIAALKQAAQKAIAKYYTSVSTEIRASPPPRSTAGDSVEGDDPLTDPETTSGAPLSHSWVDRVREGLEGYDSETDDELDLLRRRKPSIVSVSTTISMKSETLSPQPRPSLSRAVSSGEHHHHHHSADHDSEADDGDEDNEGDGDDLAAALTQLSDPPYTRALLLLAQMSSADNMFSADYTAACVRHAREHRDFVLGFIAMRSLNERPDDNFITMTPGVQLAVGTDALGQRYNTPHAVIAEAGCDVIIVGRGIIAADNRKAAAIEFQKQGWAAYVERLQAARKARK